MKPAIVSGNRASFRVSIRSFATKRLAGLLAGFAAICLSVPAQGSTAFTYIEHEDSITITGHPFIFGALAIPNSINDKPVTAIGDVAFQGQNFMSGISMPNTVTSIGNNAFVFCSGLQTVTLSSSLVSIGNNAFQNCSSLPGITLPASLQSIGDYAFDNCINLGNVVLPGGLAHLGEAAFQNCGKLGLIAIPPGIARILPSTFQNCTALTSVTLPAGLNSIGLSAFHGCSNLTAITIPAGVTQIGDQAFRSCSKLASATFRGDAPVEFGANVFNSTATGFTIYYYAVTTGFTTPTWKGRATVELGDNTLGTWRDFYDVPAEAALADDLNGDGISLLMAYALTLDPNRILSGAMPVPAVNETADSMSLRFQARAFGVTYVVETTADFVVWTTDGVTVSEPDDAGFRTASVGIDGTPRFFRLGVSYDGPGVD